MHEEMHSWFNIVFYKIKERVWVVRSSKFGLEFKAGTRRQALIRIANALKQLSNKDLEALK
jgi:hypothetical protein